MQPGRIGRDQFPPREEGKPRVFAGLENSREMETGVDGEGRAILVRWV